MAATTRLSRGVSTVAGRISKRTAPTHRPSGKTTPLVERVGIESLLRIVVVGTRETRDTVREEMVIGINMIREIRIEIQGTTREGQVVVIAPGMMDIEGGDTQLYNRC